MMLKVSVIIPIYNVEKYLAECLESVIGQTLQDIEVICVDDGSTDGSWDILKQFALRDERIRILRNDSNRGQSCSRNRGLVLAQGEYVYFLDADDKIVNHALETLYLTAVSHELDGIFFDAFVQFEAEDLKKKFVNYRAARDFDYSGIYDGGDLFAQFVRHFEWSASVPRQFWRRSFLIGHNLRFYEGILHEDELFSFQAILKARRVTCLKDRLFIRRFRENSTMTGGMTEKHIEGKLTAYFEMLAFWKSYDGHHDVHEAINTHLNLFFQNVKAACQSFIQNQDRKWHFAHPFTDHLFRQFVMAPLPVHLREIDEQKISRIKQFQHVLIYGAGKVAREVLEVLDRHEIPIAGFAVSNTAGNPAAIMGMPVYPIEKFVPFKDEVLVLVSVIPRYQPDVLRKLDQLGFQHVLLMM